MANEINILVVEPGKAPYPRTACRQTQGPYEDG